MGTIEVPLFYTSQLRAKQPEVLKKAIVLALEAKSSS